MGIGLALIAVFIHLPGLSMIKPNPPSSDNLLTRGVLALSLGALLAAALSRCQHIHRRRLHSIPKTLAEPLQTWEGEGGEHRPPARKGP